MEEEKAQSVQDMLGPEVKDSFVVCPHCGSELCYSQTVGEVETLTCLSCGFTTSNLMLDGSETEQKVRASHPNLYKELRFVDVHGYVWYPSVVSVPEAGMVYIDGSNAENWEWVMTPVRLATRRERRLKKLGAGPKYIALPNMTKRFGKEGFVEALAALGLFR